MLRIVLRVGLFCAREQFGNLLLEAPFSVDHPSVAHRLVLGRVGIDLGTVDGDVPELDQSRLLAQPKHLQEQPREGAQVLLTKRRDAVVIRMLVARKNAKRYILIGRPLNLARRPHANAVRVHEKRHHHPRVVPARPRSSFAS